MTQINLLPWREEARQIKKLQFSIFLGIAVGIAILIVIMLHIFVSHLVNNQLAANQFLQNQLDQERKIVANLKKQKEERNALLSQLKYGYKLQKQSFKAVSIMNILANSIPDGVTLTKITREGNKVTLIGETQSTLGVTAFMKNIEKTNQFNQPVLTKISDDSLPQDAAANQDLFQIEVMQKD